MDLVTQNDARGALGALTNDLHQVYEDVPNIDALVGDSQLQSAAYSLLDTINNYAQKVYNGLSESDAPLTATQKKQLKELQREVIDARKTIAQTISDVSWNFPDLVVQSLSESGNILGGVVDTTIRSAEGVVAGVLKQLGIGSWLLIIIGGVILITILVGRNPISIVKGLFHG